MQLSSAITIVNQLLQVFILPSTLERNILAYTIWAIKTHSYLIKLIKALQTLVALHVLLILKAGIMLAWDSY